MAKLKWYLCKFSLKIQLVLMCLVALTLIGCQSPSTIPSVSLVEKPTPIAIPEAQTVAFCDLVSSLQLYNQKIVRTRAIAVATRELGFLYDPECNSKEHWIDFECDNNQAFEILNPFLEPSLEKNRNFPTRAKVTVVGRFDGPSKEGYGHLNSFQLHFAIMAVEKAEEVPADIPGPWPNKKSF